MSIGHGDGSLTLGEPAATVLPVVPAAPRLSALQGSWRAAMPGFRTSGISMAVS